MAERASMEDLETGADAEFERIKQNFRSTIMAPDLPGRFLSDLNVYTRVFYLVTLQQTFLNLKPPFRNCRMSSKNSYRNTFPRSSHSKNSWP